MFIRKNNIYNTGMKSDFITSQNKTVLKGSNSIQCYGSMIWNFIPAEINCADSLETFKSKIRMWKSNNYPCRI